MATVQTNFPKAADLDLFRKVGNLTFAPRLPRELSNKKTSMGPPEFSGAPV